MAKAPKKGLTQSDKVMLQLVGNDTSQLQTDENDVDKDELRALAELDSGSGIKWSVHRVSDMGGKLPGYCGSLTTAELSLDRIASEWGIGRYKVRGTHSNGQFAGQNTITIAEPPKGANGTAAPGVPPVAAQTGVADYIALMEARDEKSSRNMREWATILVPLAAPLIANLLKPAAAGPTLAELTTTLQNMKTLSGEGSNVSKIEELKNLIDVVRGLDPPDKSGSTWVDLIRDTVKEAGPMVTGLLAARSGHPAPVPVVTATAQPNPQLQRQEIPVAGSDPMLQFLGWLREQLSALTHQASLNKDPGLYAEVVVDNIPAGVDPRLLLEQLSRPDWWAVLTQFHSGVQPYPQWFAECRDSMVQLLTEMTAAPTAPAAPVKTAKGKQPKAGVPAQPMPQDSDHGED